MYNHLNNLYRCIFNDNKDTRDYLVSLAETVYGPGASLSQGYDIAKEIRKNVQDDSLSEWEKLVDNMGMRKDWDDLSSYYNKRPTNPNKYDYLKHIRDLG